jgi:hypothetical protein
MLICSEWQSSLMDLGYVSNPRDTIFEIGLDDSDFMMSVLMTSCVVRDRMLDRKVSKETLHYTDKTLSVARKHVSTPKPPVNVVAGLVAATVCLSALPRLLILMFPFFGFPGNLWSIPPSMPAHVCPASRCGIYGRLKGVRASPAENVHLVSPAA